MNYINELELKSLILRIKNARRRLNTVKTSKTISDNSKKSLMDNRKIKKYIEVFNKIKKIRSQTEKHKRTLEKIKTRVIEKSEKTSIDQKNYELFGVYIIEMVNHILTKPQFRNYSYYNDFLSDSEYKILRYIDNFDHKKTSKISGQSVDAFSYISQIIHNSIIFIITKNKRYNDFIESQIIAEKIKCGYTNNLNLLNYDNKTEATPIMYTINSDNYNDVINTIKENDKNAVITVFYYDLELEDINKLCTLRKQFKRMKVVEGLSDE